jgi:hypothetical protein
MVNSTKNVGYNGLVKFLEKMQRNETVDIEEKIDGAGTPLGTLCVLFIGNFGGKVDHSPSRLLVFDYLVSAGASLDGTVPNGETVLEYASSLENAPHLKLIEHILKYHGSINPATVEKAYKDAKANNRPKIVKLFNDVGVNG